METERKDFRMSGLEERERAVELYFTTPMTTAQVVEHLGYPTRQCLERWPAMDSRYAGHMAKPIIPLGTGRRAVEPVPGGMQQKQAAKQLGAGVGAVHGWVRAYRKGGMAALQPKNRNSAQGNKPVFCQIEVVQNGVSIQSEKAAGFSPVERKDPPPLLFGFYPIRAWVRLYDSPSNLIILP